LPISFTGLKSSKFELGFRNLASLLDHAVPSEPPAFRYEAICLKSKTNLLRIADWTVSFPDYAEHVHGLGRPTGWVRSRFLAFWWVGLGRGSEVFTKILKLGRPLVTAEVIPDKLIMINADK